MAVLSALRPWDRGAARHDQASRPSGRPSARSPRCCPKRSRSHVACHCQRWPCHHPRHVLHGDGRCAIVAMAVESLYLGRKRAGQVWNCVHVEISLGHADASARGTARRKRSFAAGEPVKFSIVGIFGLSSRREPDGHRHGRSWKLRDDTNVPLICPTCQKVFEEEASMPATALLLCMGLFSIF
jgi:hypothetical protein